MQINPNEQTLNFRAVRIAKSLEGTIKTQSSLFRDVLDSICIKQQNNKNVDIYLNTLRKPCLRFSTGDFINNIWHFERGPMSLMLLDEKYIINDRLRYIIQKLRTDYFEQPLIAEKTVGVKSKSTGIISDVNIKSQIAPLFHCVGEFLPEKYFFKQSLRGCTPTEAAYLRRIGNFAGWASYFNDILKIADAKGIDAAVKFIKSQPPVSPKCMK